MQCGPGVLGLPVMCPRGHLKQDVASHVEEELGAGAKAVKERREVTKSGGLSQARKQLPAGTDEESASQFPGGYRVGGPDELL
jgi:hypothetical protein